MFDISQIIKEESIKILFQIILSPTETSSISIEALTRGINPVSMEEILPIDLFKSAGKQGLTYDLDKLCIRKTIEAFKPIYNKNKKAILYININLSSLSKLLDEDYIYKQALAFNLPANRIVIDLNNTSLSSMKLNLIYRFIHHHRDLNFYICIDDIGKNYSNLDKIMLLNPDIIKINHQLLSRLQHKDYKDLMIDYIGELAHKMGILVIYTGVESQDDIISSLKMGAQLIQGFYICKLWHYEYQEIVDVISSFDKSSIHDLVNAKYIGSERSAITNILTFINNLKLNLQEFDTHNINDYAKLLLDKYAFIESGFVIDSDGNQFSKAFVNKTTFKTRNKELFGLYSKGSDHRDEEFFIQLQNKVLTDWVTKPYRSKLTNEVCSSASFKIEDIDGKQFIIVINIDYNAFNLYNQNL